MILYAGQLKDYNYDIEVKTSHHKKNGSYTVSKFNNTIITFDIETSSGWIEDGNVIPYRKGMPEEYWNDLEPVALCYIWQCCVDGTVYYGRELSTFIELLEDLPKDADSIVWVHNLSWEFHFLADILHWNDVFARSPHKPMKAISKEFPRVEFRCSYMLTRLSLATWGTQLNVPKMVGDLDYEVLRTPLTELTDKELKYCEQDVIVVYKGIQAYMAQYGTLRNIPLTQTGTVRRVVKEMLTSNPEYVKAIKRLVPCNADEYKMLQDVFAGGYTHANRLWAGHVIKDHIEHYDFSSSYPTVMICEKMPCTPWQYTGWKHLPEEDLFDDYAYIIKVRFYNIESTSFNTYIQHSKCFTNNVKLDNGRVISADVLETIITEQDLITIKHNYKWESVEVSEVYESRKYYLPKSFREYILELYGNKTSLKGIEGKEEIYMQSKQYINSLFGMTVTALVQSECALEGDIWDIKPLTREYVEHKLEMLRHWNPREKRYFLNYSWGCWITAYARRNLWECIESIDHDVLYADTDSIFCIGKHDFSWYNEKVTEKLRKSCEYSSIDFDKTRPLTVKGKSKPLGVFDKEPDVCEFITLGAKRYCERREDGKLYLTISGINKEAVALLNNDISNFKDEFVFDKDHDSVTKKQHSYVYNMPDIRWPDGYLSRYKRGINLRRAGYTLGITDAYKDLIRYMEYDIDDLPEHFFISARGRFN